MDILEVYPGRRHLMGVGSDNRSGPVAEDPTGQKCRENCGEPAVFGCSQERA